MNALPVIIHRYLNKCTTVAQPPGLADFLKGTVYLYQQSKRGPHPPSFVLVPDFSHHPMGLFIVPDAVLTQTYQAAIANSAVNVTECFNQYRPVIRNLVATLQHNPETSPQITYAVCHEPYDDFDSNDSLSVLSSEDQSYMKSVLTFHPELLELADQMMDDLGLTEDFAVVHLRMGDQQSADESAHAEQLAHVEAFIQNTLIPQWGKRILVLSDSFFTKKYLRVKYGLACTDFVPVHMGESARFLNRREAASVTDIGQTLVEFILMSRSQSIYLYSVYGWCSGFSKLAAHIYGIPYVPIPKPEEKTA